MNTYTALSPRTTAFVVKDLLERGFPYLVFEKFGMTKPLPSKSTKTMKWRRYFLSPASFTNSVYNPYEYYENNNGTNELFDVTTVAGVGQDGGRKLTEGVTPQAIDLDSLDIEVSIDQFGAYTEITDQIQDLHEDSILQESIDILGETGAFLAERVRYNALKGGSNVYYATDDATPARDKVNQPISLTLQRNIVRGLKRNLGKPITKVVKSNANYGTESIAPSYVGVCHTDVESDIRSMDGFVPAEKYGAGVAWEGEIGKVESVRYVLSTVVSSLGEVGHTTVPATLIGTDYVNVYPILYFAANAYALVPLKGKNAITPMVLNPNVPRGGDPLGQRGSVGIKFYHACVILHDFWMARAEVGVSKLS